MIKTTLGIINGAMNTLDVPYEFMRWTSTVPDRYWVGEYSETPTDTEDGYEESTIILTGTTKGLWSVLMDDMEKIKGYFSKIGGLRIDTENGAIVIFYGHSFPVPTGEADLKRMQINLQIKAWKGMNDK